MNLNDLEKYLDKDYELGFKKKETDDPDYVGWILLRKEKVDERYLSLLDEGEDPLFVKKQEKIAEKPYILRVFELKNLYMKRKSMKYKMFDKVFIKNRSRP